MKENDKINQIPETDPENLNDAGSTPGKKPGGLRTRSITAVAIVTVYVTVLALTVALDWRWIFDGFTILVTVAAALEVARAFGNRYAPPLRVFIILNVVLGYTAFYLVHFLASPNGSGGITAYFSVLAVMLLACIGYNMFSKKNSMSNVLSTMLVLVYPATICVYMLALNYFPREFANSAVIMLFLVPAFSDTGAYVIGSLFRGPKLAPKISPKKTISGACGGVLGGMLAGAVALLLSIYTSSVGQLSTVTGWNIAHYLIIGAIGSLFVLAGDLIASYIKRQCDVKDFGKLLPGHGGVLDRMDSTIICAIFLYVYYMVITLP